MKRGDRGRSHTAGRIERGDGNGGEPVRSPSGQTEISLAGEIDKIVHINGWGVPLLRAARLQIFPKE